MIICERCGRPANYVFIFNAPRTIGSSSHDFCLFHFEAALRRFLSDAQLPGMSHREREDYRLYGAIMDIWDVTHKRLLNAQVRYARGFIY